MTIEGAFVGVLDAFISTWSTARETFGQGVPQTGEQFDESATLQQLETTVASAAPGSRWTGTASAAYDAANKDHGKVIAQLADLDQRLGKQVTASSHVVASGRQDLDAVRKWVLDAAASVPPGKNREQLLMPIVQKGLGQVSQIVTKSNGELSTIGGQIRTLSGEYAALGNQKFGPKEGVGDGVLGEKGDEEAEKKAAEQAANDFKAVRDGNATPEQVARVREASTLTPEQTASLKEGKPATMDQGQYDYLRGLMQAQDGMSASEVNESLKQHPELKAAMGDAYQIMGNPNIQTASGDHGGITNEPRNIQALLNDDLTYKTQGGGQVPQIPLHQFDALNDMLGQGNPELRAGSDVDRAMVNESARISDLVDKGHAVYSDTPDSHGGKGGIPFGIADTHDVNRTLNSMIATGGSDHQAVTDFLTGANDPNSAGAQRMSAATFDHFGGKDAFVDLTTHQFGDGQNGVEDMFDWMGKNAYTPGLEGFDAAASANATGHLISSNHELFTRLPDGHGGYDTLGQVNSGLVQTFTENLSPFIGNFDGVQVPGINADAIPGFSDTKDLSNMFQVLNTDPASADALNRVVASWEQHFAYEFGATGDSEFGRHAGQLTQAMTGANHSALDAMKTNQDWDAIRAFSDQERHWDTTKEILSGVAGLVPGGDVAVQLANVAEPSLKNEILGIQGDPGNMSDAAWETALTATDENFNHLVDGHVRDFHMAQGYIDADPAHASDFRNVEVPGGTTNFVDQNGRLDWDAINANRAKFDSILDSSPLSYLNNWDDGNHGYDSGLKDTNIHPQALPDPGTPASDAPR
ncbi:EspA/EspE family type VII secretion system effector [Mycolicibacterium sp.]|uniref:TPR repeat region-containing protein n=1 Tax=Mycolicibacterium sp. TaxID=2320850 RepID=UPI001A2AC2D3|nr:EspA/EspE family type VII secretion system effector [Mycolicibacterium sp.]MBJ7340754.1 hypothetical protein [Mycolicibacterium sp.]